MNKELRRSLHERWHIYSGVYLEMSNLWQLQRNSFLIRISTDLKKEIRYYNIN